MIDAALLESELNQLASFSDVAAPAVTRIVFSDVDMQARAWFKERCRKAGLAVREDAVGNTFARWQGEDPVAAAVATGSHIDAIPSSGRYDGTVGVLGGLEAIRSLQRQGFTPKKSIELLLFTSEEPTRFGIGCLGSRLLSGALEGRHAGAVLRDASGDCLDTVREAAGFTGPLESLKLSPGHYSAFVELHIEQGPLLEAAALQIGLVTGIAAPASLQIVVEGSGGHAGAVLMPMRRDALTAASELILEIERLARSTGSSDSVATTGLCNVFPGAVNGIPSRVTLGVDVRDTDLARRDVVLQQIQSAAERIASQRQVTFTTTILNADAPAQCDAAIVGALQTSCQEENVVPMEMVSRAYHDALFMSRIAPTAMLFIPCRDGISHRPDEFASMQDIAAGVRVLARTLAHLSS